MTDQTPLTTTLRALAGDTERLLGDRLRPTGITVPQLEFLTWIAAHPECCGADVAEAVHVSPQTGTTVLHNLLAKKLIRVKPAKGRRNSITVTARGTAAVAQAQDAVAEVEKHLAAALGGDVAHAFAGAVTALQPHLPQRGWQRKPKATTNSKSKAKARAAKPKARRDPLAGDRIKAEQLDQHCREWAATVGNSQFVPDHVAAQYGTQAQIDLLVVARRWSPEHNGYRLND